MAPDPVVEGELEWARFRVDAGMLLSEEAGCRTYVFSPCSMQFVAAERVWWN